MTDIVTVPQSILERLNQVQKLANQDRLPEAGATLAQVLMEVARSQPELCALMVAAQLGYRELSLQQTVRTTDRHVTDRQILGFSYGQDESTTTKTTTTARTIRLR